VNSFSGRPLDFIWMIPNEKRAACRK
jgi:hypothetical protein